MLHFAYGLRIKSEIALGLLTPPQEQQHPPTIGSVRIYKGPCPARSWPTEAPTYFEWNERDALFSWRDVGCFWMRGGQEVIVEPAQGVADHLLRPVLLGPVLAILLLQCGFLVLHASAVAFENPDGVARAAAFLGHSGQGKSTMATALHQRGHRALADDTIAVPVDGNSSQLPLIFPALPHLKLRVPSAQALGENVQKLSRWLPDNDSYVVPLTARFSFDPVPLRCLYCLEEGNSIEVQLMDQQEALMDLLERSYCIRLLPDNELQSDFLKCAQLAQQLPIFRLKRPKNFQLLPDVIRVVEEHQKMLSQLTEIKS